MNNGQRQAEPQPIESYWARRRRFINAIREHFGYPPITNPRDFDRFEIDLEAVTKAASYAGLQISAIGPLPPERENAT